MKILGIETSCDETGIAIYDTDHGLLAHQLYSQIALHAQYGGVVPELASRDHIRKTLPLIEDTLQQAGLTVQDIDGIAYTAGPGLVGALMVGGAIAQGLALALSIPIIGVHHMEAHLLAPWLEENHPEPPLIALLVSGGHTQLIQMDDIGQYTLLGESVDDAAGEAFDKIAKVLGLPYPGGPALAQLAVSGNSQAFKLPRPMLKQANLNFSFSGLKTAVITTLLAHIKKQQQTDSVSLDALKNLDQQTKADIARCFEDAVVDTLSAKCERALQQSKLKTLVIAGGVSANQHLRAQMAKLAEKHHWQVFYPRHEFCTDNGAMIALAGAMRLQRGQRGDDAITVHARWPLTDLQLSSGLV